MVVFAGQGDARRSMALLWRRADSSEVRTGPGPKPALSIDTIIEAAIAIADADGISGLSMRAVGERLGRSGMALYTYVPSKSELVDLMHDRALAELPAEYEMAAGWWNALTCWAEDLCAFYVRHPWVLQVSTARPVLGPHEYAMLNTVLGILYATGLGATMLRRIVGLLFHYVRGAAQTIAESRQAASATGVSDEEWWSSRSTLLENLAPDFAERFPMVIWLEADGAPPPSEATETAERPSSTGSRGESAASHLDNEAHLEGEAHLENEAKETFRVGLGILLDGIEAAQRRAFTGPDLSLRHARTR